MKNNSLTRRLWIGAAGIIAVCVIGLMSISSQSGEATSATTADAAQVGGELTAQQASPFSAGAGGSVLQMIAALALVLACIYGCVFLIKRFGVNRAGLSRDKRMLEVIDSISVGPKKMIAVVRVGERAVVVGITESGMTSLTELDKEELPETVKSTGAAQHAHRPSFSGLLDSMMNRSRSEARSAESNAGTVAP